MAYTQSPGRGNNAKTGHGIPSPFKQEGPKTMKRRADVAKKEVMGDTYAEIKSAERFANKAPGTGLMGGTETNIKSGKTQAKSYEKSLKSGKELGLEKSPNDMFITDSAGKVIKKAEARNPKAVEALKKEFASKKSSTEDARSANAVGQNYRLKIAGK